MWTKPKYVFAETIPDLKIYGQPAPYPVVNERAVKATAGIMLMLATVSLMLYYFTPMRWPLQVVTTLFAIDFSIRLVFGLTPFSPLGMLGTWIVKYQVPEFVAADQKRFAWAIGWMFAVYMSIVSNMNLWGPIVFGPCLFCLTLLWIETCFSLCAGCFTYHLAIRWKIIPEPEIKRVCPGGICSISERD